MKEYEQEFVTRDLRYTLLGAKSLLSLQERLDLAGELFDEARAAGEVGESMSYGHWLLELAAEHHGDGLAYQAAYMRVMRGLIGLGVPLPEGATARAVRALEARFAGVVAAHQKAVAAAGRKR